jgi:hypothetical protein
MPDHELKDRSTQTSNHQTQPNQPNRYSRQLGAALRDAGVISILDPRATNTVHRRCRFER